jgi:hypothetical protein
MARVLVVTYMDLTNLSSREVVWFWLCDGGRCLRVVTMGQLTSSFDRMTLRYRSSLALFILFHMLINALSIGHRGWRIILQRCCHLVWDGNRGRRASRS